MAKRRSFPVLPAPPVRALGMGPRQQPRVSSTSIRRPSRSRPTTGGTSASGRGGGSVRREEETIRAADALICGSQSNSSPRQAEGGTASPGQRPPSSLSSGAESPAGTLSGGLGARPICCRPAERRKGVLEWIDAAVAVARENPARNPDIRFDFVGPNVLGLAWISGEAAGGATDSAGGPAIVSVFHGSQPRAELPRFLREARIAVVPSRWENFPTPASRPWPRACPCSPRARVGWRS